MAAIPQGGTPGASSTVERCPHRNHVRSVDDVETARCGLLGRLSGVDEPSLLDVRRDACDACFRLPDSCDTRINHVHASLLYSLAERVIARDGVPGCDLGKAVGIRGWAERNLRFDDGLDPVDFEALSRVGLAEGCVHFGAAVLPERDRGVEELDTPAQHVCLHPSHERTTVIECFRCRDWNVEPAAAPEPLSKTFRHKPARAGDRVERWAVGVTTTRRFEPTLTYCLDSLLRAGWSEPRIFADSEVEIADRHRELPISVREPRLGAWPNYYLSLVEMLMREPHADAYMLVQDDALLYDHEELRRYLQEEVLWPAPDTGAVSLYCSREYSRPAPGWFELGRNWVWGAVAFIFPRESVQRLVTDRKVLEHRRSKRNEGRANIDVVIGDWASRRGLKMFFPTPSLAQHIGESSTLWPTAGARGSRRANTFRGDRA